MILEIEDLEKTHTYGSVAVPPGLTLGRYSTTIRSCGD